MSQVKTYRLTIPLGDVRVSEVQTVLETLRQRGHATLRHDDDGLPESVTVEWEVGDESVEDLWDLREIVDEIEAQLSPYFSFGVSLGKPEEAGPVSAVGPLSATEIRAASKAPR